MPRDMTYAERVRAGISPAMEGDIWEYGTARERAERRAVRSRKRLPLFHSCGKGCKTCAKQGLMRK